MVPTAFEPRRRIFAGSGGKSSLWHHAAYTPWPRMLLISRPNADTTTLATALGRWLPPTHPTSHIPQPPTTTPNPNPNPNPNLNQPSSAAAVDPPRLPGLPSFVDAGTTPTSVQVQQLRHHFGIIPRSSRFYATPHVPYDAPTLRRGKEKKTWSPVGC